MSVESGVSAPSGRGAASPRSAAAERPATRRRRGPDRADALADAVSTPSFPEQKRGRPRRRGRRVRRVVRRIELWSVLKISLVFNTVMLGIALGAVAVLWGLANTTGLISDLEGFLRDSGFEDFRFEGDRMFRRVAFIGAVATLAFSVFTVLATALLNLISELTGGIKFVVIEEIVDAEPAPTADPAPAAPPFVDAAPGAPSSDARDTRPAPGPGPGPRRAKPSPSGSSSRPPSGAGRPRPTAEGGPSRPPSGGGDRERPSTGDRPRSARRPTGPS